MKKTLLFLLSLLSVLTLMACNSNNNNENENENVIFVTLYPLQYLVEEIAGDTVIVEYVPGVAAHSTAYDWSAQEIIDISDSDLLFFVNGGADNFITASASVFEGENVELVDMSNVITYNEVCLSHTHDHEEETEEDTTNETCDENNLTPDPHFWLDPVRMKQAAEYIKAKLVSTYPDNSETYENNWTVLKASLEKLDSDFQTMADNATKPIITTVRLWTYFEESYGIEILSITNDVHSSEGTAGDYTELIYEADYHDIISVVFEKNANSPEGDVFMTALQDEYDNTGKGIVEQYYMHGLGMLTPDEIERDSTYISIMYDNLEVLNAITK